MTDLPHFPESLLREKSLMWEIMGSVVSPGQTASGVMPATRLDGGGLWKATLSDVSLRTADEVRAWRALAAICDQGVQPIIVPMCDKRCFPAPVVAGVRVVSYDDVLHVGDVSFDSGVGYHFNVVDIVLAEAGALRSTSLKLQINKAGDLRGGEHFSIDNADVRWRLYRIRTAVDNGDGTWNITLRTPLRAAAPAGTRLNFDHPKCVMRLSSADAMDLALEQRKFGNPSVSFVEAFPPFPA